MKKNILFTFICFGLIINLTACSPDKSNRLKVVSSDYPEIKYLISKEFDSELLSLWTSPNNPYQDYNCYISMENNDLCISNKAINTKMFLQQFNNGYFVGVNLGEFDGWVRYYPYYSNDPIAGPSRTVTTENCCGIIPVDREHGYLLTYGEFLSTETDLYEYRGVIYNLSYSYDKREWEWNILTSFDGIPYCYSYVQDNSILYVVIGKNIVSVDANGKLTVIVESELVEKIATNSIIYVDGLIYCGSPMGVYSYCVSTGQETWYPLDYELFIK